MECMVLKKSSANATQSSDLYFLNSMVPPMKQILYNLYRNIVLIQKYSISHFFIKVNHLIAIVTTIKEKTQSRTAIKKVMNYVVQDDKTFFKIKNGEMLSA